MPSRTFCVVGAGMAGGRAARSLRDRGFEGRIVLLGEEAEPPYERPPLSKAFLTGGLAADKLYLQPAATYAELGIEWRPSVAVTELDPGRSRLHLSDGETLDFDRMLLATGSRPRTLALPGAGLPGVLSYRTLSDAESLREALQHRPQVVVVGGGFLGSELAAAARQQGCPVTLVEAGPALLAPLGPLVGAFCTGLHRDAGVELLVGAAPVGFLGGSQVEQVELEGGRLLPCDLVLVCVGAEPNVELAERAG
ncbi:MAG TPA: NAD(P)/FAD-dependent oxidoreductase, partial [Candidatus Dormibacteraeota bacterium]